MSLPFAATAATTYSTSFDDPPFEPGPFGDENPVSDFDGWIDDTDVDFISFLNDSPLGGASSPQAAVLGGAFASPGPMGTEVNLFHPISIDLVSLDFFVDFSIQGSTVDAPGADNFGFSVFDGADPLMRVAFENTAPAGFLEIVWYDNSDTRNTLPGNPALPYSASSTLTLDFTPSGGDAFFNATVASGNSVSFSGTLPGEGATVADNIGVDFDVQEDGDNFIVFDNFTASAVPEPGSSILALLGLTVFLRRRR